MGQNQMELNAKAGSNVQKSDQQLNAVYTKLRAKISDAGKKSLQTAQQSCLLRRPVAAVPLSPGN